MPSLLDMFSPEAQQTMAILAVIASVAGLLLWSLGLKIARFSVAIFLGLLIAFLGATQLPRDVSISPITASLIGFAAGALLGAIAFKLLQGVVLAACVGLA